MKIDKLLMTTPSKKSEIPRKSLFPFNAQKDALSERQDAYLTGSTNRLFLTTIGLLGCAFYQAPTKLNGKGNWNGNLGWAPLCGRGGW